MMLRRIARYAHWLHGRWPAGTVERFPEVRAGGATRVPGVYVSGDLTGIPLLKFALDSGARVVERIASDLARRSRAPGLLDLVIVGGGVSGMAAAIEARRRGLSFRVIEAAQPFATLRDFPKAKPIYTYPLEMAPAGGLAVTAQVKEALVDELERQVAGAGIEVIRTRAERVGKSRDHLLVILEEGEPVRARNVLIAVGITGCTIRRTSAGSACWWWAVGTRRWRPRSHWRRPARASRSPTASPSSRAPNTRTS
ncbi:MAG: NAD(P)/FAD-dependent oxidoreductase [Candidatus Eisenbacteria bacterium]|uniref:NAD(P)/FAD-dependent oxidoreductase n=1 Tax=Eiseniibacteriota bacterium TaxID=2212470 RepID=A0A538SP19_UNCEI|nr:MAG: NAD(P)/FAD-dependent oxidoreductase [Candidatus Eisenbacteria bacterium]